MKKYSVYFYTMMTLALLCAIVTYNLATIGYGSACAITTVLTFIFWFAGVMAPDNEKYRGQ